jgi:hypothetical protein
MQGNRGATGQKTLLRTCTKISSNKSKKQGDSTVESASQTDRTIPINKPDIIRDNEKGICMLIDVAILGDRNVIEKEAEKILKYKDLTIEIQNMWNIKARGIPVITGTAGTISKSFRKYVSDITGSHDGQELQKTAILGTANLLR